MQDDYVMKWGRHTQDNETTPDELIQWKQSIKATVDQERCHELQEYQGGIWDFLQ